MKTIGAYNAKPTSGGFGTSGEPDRIVCIKGQFVGIEVKREGKEPTAIQQRRMAAITAAGGTCFWGTADKVIEEIKAWLATFENPSRNTSNHPLQSPAKDAAGVQPLPIPESPPVAYVADVPVSLAGIAGRRSK